MDDHGLSQMVEVPTRHNSTLDLFITNMPSKVQRVDTTPGISDHDIVFLEYDTNPKINKQKPRSIPLYKKANWQSLAEEMKELHSTIQIQNENNADVEQMWNTFKTGLRDSVTRHIHKCTSKNSKEKR